jgi:hypothetical protein
MIPTRNTGYAPSHRATGLVSDVEVFPRSLLRAVSGAVWTGRFKKPPVGKGMQASAPHQVAGRVQDTLPEHTSVLKLVTLLVAGQAVLRVGPGAHATLSRLYPDQSCKRWEQDRSSGSLKTALVRGRCHHQASAPFGGGPPSRTVDPPGDGPVAGTRLPREIACHVNLGPAALETNLNVPAGL